MCAPATSVVRRIRSVVDGDLRAALGRDPAVPEAHFNLPVLAWNRGERARAIRELRHELSVNPTHAPARYLLEELLAR